MSKELVISANRHETRVAVMEDDQVVEIYHQRENEYSLAGSIHKGRVTRVLPGMQSAFVDIGLGRDAFLYVSDFFEDNDEYDKVVTEVEEKVLKYDRAPAAAAPPPALAPEVSSPEGAAETLPTSTGAVEPAVPVDVAPLSPPASAMIGPPERRERRDGRTEGRGDSRGEGRGDGRGGDRGGRRSRRGRGGRGGDRGRGGLPESKFYSPRQEEARSESPAETRETETAAAEPEHADDFLLLPGESLAKYVLPGESLAKYSNAEEAEPEADDLEDESASEIEAIEVAVVGVETDPVEEPAAAAPEPEPPAAPEPVAERAHAAEPAEITPELFLAREAVEEARADERQAEAEKVFAGEATDTGEIAQEPVSAEAAEESEVEVPGDEAVEAGEELAGVASTADADPVVGEGVAVMEEEGPEPARIPTSLTATLREQGQRQHLHRISRRTRRRGRGGDRGERGPAQEGQPQRPPQEGRPAPESRDIRPPQEGRPEQQQQRPPREGRENAPSREPRENRPPLPSISDLLREGQEIIVQIAKEPLGQKGARITSHIALPGRFLVYMPTVDHIGVSRKIPSDDERLRLKRVLQANRTGIPGGYIVRTAGDGRTEEELRADMMFLYNMWLDMRQKAERRAAPVLIHHDLNVVERILRDQLTTAYKSVWVDNEEVYESVLRFVQRFQPALVNRVKLYTRSVPIFDQFGVTAELEKALRPKVWLKSGGYIVINQTEALVAIDINTGKYVGKSNRLEDTIVKTNTDAIKEIVRQIRLRDLGGIIVVDFIDMDERKNRQKVMQALEEAMRADRAPYKILQFNDFGLVAITRKRVKQSLERTLCTPCPYCEGAGYVKSPQTVVGEILQEAHKIAKAVEGNDVMLRVAPDVAKVLKSNSNTYLQEIEEILQRTVIVKSDPQLHQEKFDLA